MRRLVVMALLAGCGGPPPTGPVPITYGEDTCDICRMIISEAPFAAEARFAGGKVEKYDDVGCLAERLSRGGEAPLGMWVADHATSGWIAAEKAHYVLSETLPTPMGSGVAAFTDRAAAEQFAPKNRGKLIGFEDVRRLKRPE